MEKGEKWKRIEGEMNEFFIKSWVSFSQAFFQKLKISINRIL